MKCRTTSALFCFNSIKVQLEPEPKEFDLGDALFQFHKGAIRTRDTRRRFKNDISFNSIKVQLEQTLYELMKDYPEVSIP